MQPFKISLITVTYNAERTIKRCIESVISQTYSNLEYIIIDGNSTDNTIPIIKEYSQHVNVFISEPDKGIYDAMNKGIQFASGSVIGMLNADDVFAANNILSTVATAFANADTEVLYGDLEYVNPKGEVVRKWQSGLYKHGMFNWGWMPPHPTFYCKMALFKQLGAYNLMYGTAADYELMLRFMHANKLTVCYLNKTMVKMNTGGVSNNSYLNRLNAWRFDFSAMRKNGVLFPLLCVIFKPIRKIGQFFK